MRFLESHKAEKFTFEEIQTIPISKDTPSIWPKDIRRPTVRQYVASLVPAIDRFLKDPKKNHLHGTPTTYKGTTFLSWKDGESYFSSEFIQRQIDARLKDHYALTHIYKRIDRETFERDSRKTQEFIFYPEMNKLIRQPQEKK